MLYLSLLLAGPQMQVAASRIAGPSNNMGMPKTLALLASALFFACMLGIFTRPIGLLATFWPVNALMLGILIRMPATRNLAGWIVSFGAFLAADLLTGATLWKAVVLNLANLLSVAAAFSIFRRLPSNVVTLKDPSSAAYLLLGSTAGAFAGGICGMAANPLLFGGSVEGGFGFWFVTELANYIAVLPVILAAPTLPPKFDRLSQVSLRRLIPALVLIFSCMVAIMVGGPGSIAFVFPALLWCGMRYSLFITSILTAACSFFVLSMLAKSYLPAIEQSPESVTMFSFRLGVSLLALSPIMMAIKSTETRSTLAGLSDFANKDPLTNLVNRRAFADRAEEIISNDIRPSVLIILDIDHFKRVNDNFGHPNGDKVIVEFSKRVSSCLRQSDLFGRLGGEEFGLLLPNCDLSQGEMIAERIRQTVCSTLLNIDEGRSIRITVSVGMTSKKNNDSFDNMFKMADRGLYLAKNGGRNRLEIFPVQKHDI